MKSYLALFSVIPTENKEQAIRMLNASNYGLGSGLFMKDPLEAHEIAKYHLDSGLSGINRCVSSTLLSHLVGLKKAAMVENLVPMHCSTFVILRSLFMKTLSPRYITNIAGLLYVFS